MRLETETAVALDGISEKAASPFLLQDVIRIPADVLEELTPEQICLAPTIATRPKHVQVQTLCCEAVKQRNGKGAKVAQLLLYFQYSRHQRIYLQAFSHSMDPLNFTDPLQVCAYLLLEIFGAKLKPGDSVLLNAAHLSAAGSSLFLVI